MPNRPDTALEADHIAATTSYPPPPWRMQGTWIWSIHPVRRSLVADRLPRPLKPLWLPAGRTLGFSLVGQYGAGSTLSYTEAACGLILRVGPRPAIWLGGLVVDVPESVAGGRNIWHLPKELAHIAWPTPTRNRASADQRGELLLSFEGVPPRVQSLPFSLHFDVLVAVAGRVQRIPATFKGRLGITRRIRPFFPASGAWSEFGVSGYSISGMAHGLAQFGALEH